MKTTVRTLAAACAVLAALSLAAASWGYRTSGRLAALEGAIAQLRTEERGSRVVGVTFSGDPAAEKNTPGVEWVGSGSELSLPPSVKDGTKCSFVANSLDSTGAGESGVPTFSTFLYCGSERCEYSDYGIEIRKSSLRVYGIGRPGHPVESGVFDKGLRSDLSANEKKRFLVETEILCFD